MLTDAHDCCCRRSSSRRKCGLVAEPFGNSFSVGTVRLPIIGIDHQVDRHKKTSKKNLDVLLNKSRRRRRRRSWSCCWCRGFGYSSTMARDPTPAAVNEDTRSLLTKFQSADTLYSQVRRRNCKLIMPE